MGIKELSDLKKLSRTRTRRHRLGRATIVMCQNLLLWMPLYVMGSTIYVLVIEAANTQDVPSAVMYLVATTLSLFYLCIQNVATRLRTKAWSTIDGERAYAYQALAAHSLPILVTMWMVASGLCITFTAARRPLCALNHANGALSALDRGDTCIVNRVTILTGLVAMIAAMLLLLLMRNVDGANRCHLFGIVAEHKLLPLFLAQKHRTLRTVPSEVSFKCRSSTEISSRAMPTEPHEHYPMPAPSPPRSHSRTQSLNARTIRSSAPPSLLRPRPTLASIRSHASLPLPPPPSSPLPPLPSYLPPRILSDSTMHKSIYPPRSFSRPTQPRISPARSDPAFLCVPTPALSRRNLAVLTGRRRSSLSSIYSRDTTGESQILPRMSSRPSLTSSMRSSSSASIETVGRISVGGARPERSTWTHHNHHHHQPPLLLLPSKMSDSSSEEFDPDQIYTPPQSHQNSLLDDYGEERSVVDSIDMFAPLPPSPLSVRVRSSAIGVRGKSSHYRCEYDYREEKEGVCSNANLNVNERMRRHAESQHQIRQQQQMRRFSCGGRSCPKRFRFE